MKPLPVIADAPPPRRAPWPFDLGLVLVFAVLAGLSAIGHEFWRDEAQAWLIGRDLPSPAAVIAQARYEGAPPLWNLALWALARLTTRPEAMQALTWLLAVSLFWLLCRQAPLNRLQKLLLLGNYYLLYQYGTVCRNYLPGLLGLAIACLCARAPRPRPFGAAAGLVVAAFASVHTLIVAAALALAFWGPPLLRLVRRAKRGGGEKPEPSLAALPVAGLGFALAAWLMLPAPDTFYGPAHAWRLDWNPSLLAAVGWAEVHSLFPWPRPDGFFWIPPWDMPEKTYPDGLAYAGGALLTLLPLALFGRWSRAWLVWLAASAGLLLFFYVKYLGFHRHTGLLFFAYFFAWWLQDAPTAASDVSERWRHRLAGLFLTLMLAAQAVTGLWAAHTDWKRPFSCGRDAARFLRENGLAGAFIAVGPDWAASPVSAYLGRQVYLPHDRRTGSFTRWYTGREDVLDDEEFLARAREAAGGRPVVLVLDHALPDEFLARHGVTLLARAGGSLTPFEDYYIHLAAPLPAPGPGPSSSPP